MRARGTDAVHEVGTLPQILSGASPKSSLDPESCYLALPPTTTLRTKKLLLILALGASQFTGPENCRVGQGGSLHSKSHGVWAVCGCAVEPSASLLLLRTCSFLVKYMLPNVYVTDLTGYFERIPSLDVTAPLGPDSTQPHTLALHLSILISGWAGFWFMLLFTLCSGPQVGPWPALSLCSRLV